MTPNCRFSFLLIFGTWLLSACETELDLEVAGPPQPIIYGLLSATDTAHYVRVERTFRSADEPAIIGATRPDSLYFENIQVFLEKTSSGQRFMLDPVNGAAEGYPRVEGPFVTDPNRLYTITADAIDLDPGDQVTLLVDRGPDLPETTATTTLLEPLQVRTNSPFTPVNMAYERRINFAWGHGPQAATFQVRLHFRIREEPIGGPARLRTLEWLLAEDLRSDLGNERSAVTITGEQFYQFLASELPEEPGTRRFFEDFSLEVVAGGAELAEALDLAQANLGLTAAQFVPRFSNIEGGQGVFSSRAFLRRDGLRLSPASLDSLRDGRITASLNFQ